MHETVCFQAKLARVNMEMMLTLRFRFASRINVHSRCGNLKTRAHKLEWPCLKPLLI